MKRFLSQMLKARLWLAALMVAGATLSAAGPVRAQEDSDEDVAYDTKIMRQLLRGLGLRNGEEKTIDYRERSPLVVPGSTQLPAPQSDRQAVADPAWPKDFDAERRRKLVEAAKSKGPKRRFDEEGKPLTPEEMNVGRGTNRGLTSTGDRALRPSELGVAPGFGSLLSSMGFGNDQAREVDPVTVKEPERTSLVEPPTGYRKPAPTAPYKMGKSGLESNEVQRVNAPDAPQR